MSEIFVMAVAMVALANSIAMLVTDANSYESLIDRYPHIWIALITMVFALFIVIPWQLGAVARHETSAIPWEVYQQEARRYGSMNGLLALIINLIFLLWVFLLPGHLYANFVAKKTEERPIYPYTINILIGVILCMP